MDENYFQDQDEMDDPNHSYAKDALVETEEEYSEI
jgi:hypothetical protein